LKNQPPIVPVALFNRPVSGNDPEKTDNGTSINPYRKVKGMGAQGMYSVTDTDKFQ